MGWLTQALLSSLSFGVQGTVSYSLLDINKIGSAAVNTMVHCIFLIIGVGAAFVFNKRNIIKDINTIFNSYLGFIVLAGVCALLGNVLLYWAYQLGSHINPGIITTLGDGAIIISTLLAYIFYNAKVNTKQMIGMGILIFSFAMIAIGNKMFGLKDKKHHDKKHHDKKHHDKKPKSNSYLWLIVALVSALAYGGLSFFQYVITKKNSKLSMIALAMSIAIIEAIIGIVIYIMAHFDSLKGIEIGPFKNYKNDINKLLALKYLPFTILAAICDGFGLTSLLNSYKLAKNPGFSDVISDTYSIIQSILTYLFYGKKMDIVQGAALIIAVIGTGFLSIK